MALDHEYDPQSDVLEVEGVRYSGEFFRSLGRTMPVGSVFRIEERWDGVITVTILDREEGEECSRLSED